MKAATVLAGSSNNREGTGRDARGLHVEGRSAGRVSQETKGVVSLWD